MTTGGKPQPVRVITSADLVENGGTFRVLPGPALRVSSFTDAATRGVLGGPSLPVYVVNGTDLESRGVEGGEAHAVYELSTRPIDGFYAMPVYVMEGSLGVEVAAGFPNWDHLGNDWPQYLAAHQLLANTQTEATSLITGGPGGTSKWSGGILAPNGYIYGIPASSASVLKINPANDTFTTFVHGLSGSWSSGRLAYTGIAYAPPVTSNTIYRFDPATDTPSSFGAVPAEAGTRYSGFTAANNGCLYAVPRTALNVLKLDPTDESLTYFGGFGSGDKWGGGGLAPDGCIYALPSTIAVSSILKIDPSNDSATTFGSIAGITGNFSGLGRNGCLYFQNATNAYKLDPVSQILTPLPQTISSSTRSGPRKLSSNGCIYGIPLNGTTVSKIDTTTDTFSEFGNLGGGNKWNGCVMADNGSLYGIMGAATSVVRLLSALPVDADYPLGRY